MALMIPAYILAYLGGSKIATGLMMLFVFLLTKTEYHLPENIEIELKDKMIDTVNNFTECGTGHKEFSSAKFRSARLLGGKTAGRWPWMVYLHEKDAGFICGGTLIDSQHVVTAAHCVHLWNEPEKYAVILGEHSTSILTWSEDFHDISSIVRHENYNELSLDHDIALLKLNNKVIFTKEIQPVCLPPQGYPTDSTNANTYPEPLAGRLCTVLGWGGTDVYAEQSTVLQELKVHVLPRVLCTAITTSNPREYSYNIVKEDSPKFCAGGQTGEDTCQGDGGGPLLCQDDGGKYSLHGITSYGPTPCGKRHLTGVYTQVSGYRDWIDSHVK